jgi:hypothetical protein
MLIVIVMLRELVRNSPIKIRTVQVDGGSEFMNEFEDTCEELRTSITVE